MSATWVKVESHYSADGVIAELAERAGLRESPTRRSLRGAQFDEDATAPGH